VTLLPLLRDILTALVRDVVDVEVSAEFDRRPELAELRRWRADCVVIGLRSGETDAVARRLIAALPVAAMVAISHDGRHAYVYDGQGQRLVLPDVAPAALVTAVLDRLGLDPMEPRT
jgi:hypothetical protein